MTNPIDCRDFPNEEGVIISKTAAGEAYRAIEARLKAGAYRGLFADDLSFVLRSLEEFKKAK